MCYLKRTKGYMLTYRKSEGLKIIGYSDSDSAICQDSKRFILCVVDDIKRPLKIYFDNNSTILYSNNNRSSTKSKFVDIKFLISIEHIGTSFMLPNPLTKGLIPKVFHEYTAHMGVIPYDTLVEWEFI
ncbi:hypothetical protein CR513_39881, partial [Mucuna pruriens]